MFLGLRSVALISTSDIEPVPSKEFLEVQASINCGFALESVREMILT